MLSGCIIKQVTADSIKDLRRLNAVLFPVSYNDAFYTDLVSTTDKQLSAQGNSTPTTTDQLVYIQDHCVGAICCRREPILHKPGFYRIYLMTIGVLAPYRRLGLASQLLRRVLDYIVSVPEFVHACLHVHVVNSEALSFYGKHGFMIEDEICDYYARNKGVDPPNAFFVKHNLFKVQD